MSVSLFGQSDVTHALAARGVPISVATLRRYVAAGVVEGPTTVGGRPIWTVDATALDKMERNVRAHRAQVRERGFGANRHQKGAA